VIAIPLGADATMLCCHGSPRSPIEEVLATTPGADLDALLDGVDAEIIAGGHTHLQLIRQHQGRLLVNPGSVGCPFRAPASAAAPPSLLPWAEYGIVTWRDGTLGVELRRVPFDRDRFRDELSRSDLPIREWWLSQIPPSAG
ncbi:MAG TPA: metallophosphoesterase family protein, partial [Herpetosiphonaceae bacterium]